jgi:hypothetical protein
MTSMSICRGCWADFKEGRQRHKERKTSIKVGREVDIQHLGGRREGAPARGIGMGSLGRGGGLHGFKGSDSTVELSETKSSRRGDSDSF